MLQIRTLCLAAAVLSSPLSIAGDAIQPQDHAVRTDSAKNMAFSTLLSELTSGRNVRVVVSFNQCTLAGTEVAGPPIVGGAAIGDFIVPNNQYIAFASVHETLSQRNDRVTEWIRYRVMQDNKVLVRTASIQASNGAVSNEAEYTCLVGTGVTFRSQPYQ